MITYETEYNGWYTSANDWSASFLEIGPNQYRAGISGSISPRYDVDYFKIHVSTGDHVVLTCSGLRDTYLSFRNSSNTWSTGTSATSSQAARLEWTSFPYPTGEYIVGVSENYSRSGYGYYLSATITTPYLLLPGGDDYYSVRVNAGDVLTLRTSTPADGLGEFANGQDPVVTLYSPSGTQVATDDNSGGGRNALITLHGDIHRRL